ncbi:MAG TPA: esterase-like activity of phytase family protein [Gammaproteobacteria bacterium]|nr:esterase-like activity of phytase family protein [Gammaproteobacteria bacterium]
MQRIITTRSWVVAPGQAPARGALIRCAALCLGIALGAAAAAAPRGLEAGEHFEFAPRDPTRAAHGGRLRVRGALALRTLVEGHAIPREISGLAFSADDGILYAVTDAGWLLHFVPRIEHGLLVGVSLVAQHRLAATSGRPLPRGATDAEGLAALAGNDGRAGNTRLLVSFEGRPLVAEHAPDGRRLRVRPLRPPLTAIEGYDGRNHGLEALALHPAHGYIVAPERPLRGSAHTGITLYAEDGARWSYPVEDPDAQSLTGLDTLPDGTLLALERRYAGFLSPVVCTLSRLHLDGERLRVEVLARYSSANGWPVDNFEAIAWHGDRHFFVASDDNENPLQRALLIYFELPADE